MGTTGRARSQREDCSARQHTWHLLHAGAIFAAARHAANPASHSAVSRPIALGELLMMMMTFITQGC